MRGLTIAFNKTSAFVLRIVCIGVFFMLQAGAVVAPPVIGWWYATHATSLFGETRHDRYAPYTLSSSEILAMLFPIGGIIVSIIVVISLVRNIRFAFFEKDALGAEVENAKVTTLVAEMAQNVGVVRFKAIIVVPDAGASTFFASGDRYLVIGLLLLKYLTANELRAVVAHEYAHHHHGSMELNRVHYRNRMFILAFTRTLKTIADTANELDSGWLRYLGGTIGFGALFQMVALVAYLGFHALLGFLLKDKHYEYYCDSIAIDKVGGSITESALQKVLDLDLALRRVLKSARSSTRDPKFLEVVDQEYERLRASNPLERQQEAGHDSHSHPPLKLRQERARRNPGRADDSAPLLSSFEAEQLLTRVVLHPTSK